MKARIHVASQGEPAELILGAKGYQVRVLFMGYGPVAAIIDEDGHPIKRYRAKYVRPDVRQQTETWLKSFGGTVEPVEDAVLYSLLDVDIKRK